MRLYSRLTSKSQAMRTAGFRIKSGFTIAVVVSGDRKVWQVERREEVPLAIDEGKYGRFPFHPLIELEGKDATETSVRAVAAVRAMAKKNLASFLKSIEPIDSATIVVGSLIDPDDIA